MEHSHKRDLQLALLSGLVCLNSIITIGFHIPRKPPIESLMPYMGVTPVEIPRVNEIDTIYNYVVENPFYRHMMESTVLVEAIDYNGKTLGTGSGVILDNVRGIILTANHVVDGAYTIRVYTNSGQVVENVTTNVLQPAGLLDGIFDFLFGGESDQTDPKDENPTWGPKVTPYENKDCAILEFGQALNGQTAKLATLAPVIGDDIYVCGSPYGPDFFNTVSKGILSGKNRYNPNGLPIMFYQTDATVLPGNSGGPWFNSKGEVVAISSAWVPYSGNVGMGVPLPELKKIVEKI